MDTILIVGASRGLGLGLAREYAARSWQVIGTVRTDATPLHTLAAATPGRVRIETIDITSPDDIASLRARLGHTRIDLLFVNAGIANGPAETVPATSTESFTRLMLTNALAPLRVIEALADLVPEGGTIAAMSSGLGSVANNTNGGWEIYRASKAALNTLLRSFAARRGAGRSILAIAPGWVRTDMGGPNATFDVESTARAIARAIAARRGHPGAAFVDRDGHEIPW
jgi:NAD(P)-dependent dehydrogenase (short-subunit alcohol dehydrogenase family)